MEHCKTGLLLIITLLIFANCKKPLDNPEQSDPIFRELTDAAAVIGKNIDEEQKALDNSKVELKKSDLSTGEKRQILKQISSSDKKIRLMQQDKKFFELRAKSRIQHVNEVYPARFEKGLPWPDPDEIAEFEANKRLQHASRNWADRVPKLRYGPDKSATKAEKPSAPPAH